MQILSVQYHNVRNLKDQRISFHSFMNILYGKNGQGKTSFLEALYFGATGLSFRTRHSQEMISYQQESLFCSLEYEDQFSSKQVRVSLENTKKQFLFFQKKLSQMQFYGMVNVIFYIPEDVLLIHGSPQGRRLFIDREISQSNPSYLEHLKKFSYALKIRNKYLKERNTTALEYTVYEKEFIKHGSYLMYFRQKYLQESSKLLQNLYSHLFDSEKKLQMRYKSSISFSKEMDILQIQECFQQEIQKKKEKEKEYGFSLLGPHKDDFCFLLNQEDARFFSSQGEKKSIIFSLKLTEIDMIYQEKKELPVLLIDDVTSYFDLSRRNNVLQFLKEKGVQVFLTSTEPLEIEGKHYYVEKGEVYDIPSIQTNGPHSSGMATE